MHPPLSPLGSAAMLWSDHSSGLFLLRKFPKRLSTSAMLRYRPLVTSALLAGLSACSFPMNLAWPWCWIHRRLFSRVCALLRASQGICPLTPPFVGGSFSLGDQPQYSVCVTATSTVRLEVGTSCLFLSPFLTEGHPSDWSLMTKP